MASTLYKIGGLEVVEVVDPLPTDNDVPLLPPSTTNDPNIPSPIIPPFTQDSFKPLKDLSISRPTPEGNTKVTTNEDMIYVFFPDNPLQAGDQSGYIPFTDAQYRRLVELGVIIP